MASGSLSRREFFVRAVPVVVVVAAPIALVATEADAHHRSGHRIPPGHLRSVVVAAQPATVMMSAAAADVVVGVGQPAVGGIFDPAVFDPAIFDTEAA